MYYYAVEKQILKPNPVRTEGTYTKYASLDDKIDGFFYYSAFIKFGYGRIFVIYKKSLLAKSAMVILLKKKGKL